MSSTAGDKAERPIVSSRHLATEDGMPLSEFEFGLIVSYHGFGRWITRCMAAAGNQGMSALDVMVLHHVNHRERRKRLADIAFLLNIEDLHTVNYALRKLLKAELISGEKRGKEMFYGTTEAGAALCVEYRNVREACLVDSFKVMDMTPEELRAMARQLRALSGLYDQAARAAASF